jgi:amino acid adenylation domain-containing protein
MTMPDDKIRGAQDNQNGRGGNADSRPAAGPVLSESERNKILYEWNDTAVGFPAACVHELFEQQVGRDPDAIAVIFKERQLTYRELNQRANQVAHFLRKQGVGPETLVGVSLERRPELVIGLLGVWKAGGAYVPLDTGYPQERLSFMVEDAGIRMLLTEQKCRHLFPSSAFKTVCLDSDWPIIARESTDNPAAGAVPSNLAYVMYTSGSTGQPKGAMIVHSGLVNYLCWAIKAYAVEAGGSVPVHTSVSFDLTVTSLYPALLAGGQAELIPEDIAAQNLLLSLRRGHCHNLVKITPAHLDLLRQQIDPREAAGMTKLFVIGGENLVAESLQLWRDFAPNTRLVNEYGPTETVVGCCVYEMQAADPRNGSVPIGRPIANTQLYVLDSDMQLVPPGVMGELYIGGAGVARGYLNRPELTRERFVADVFSGRADARLYKTGDLARYRPDGILEYLGRVDNQVKVRGYRIELGEIEATLAGHPAVQSCAVLAREDTPGDKQLVGYIVPRQGNSPTVEDLQDFVKQRLPEYMTPGRFVFLESLPLTNNGKVDRKALPVPTAVASTEYLAARTPTERALTEIWQRLLQRDRVSTHDDFFDVGGHSLLMLKLMSEIKQHLGVDLPLSSILEHTTIETSAVAIDALLGVRDAGGAGPVMSAADASETSGAAASTSGVSPWLTQLKAGGPQCLFFVYDGDGDVLPYVNLARRMPPEFAVYGISPFGLPGIPLGHLTISEMARHCVESIQRRQPHGPYLLGGLCAGGVIAFDAARQLEQSGNTVELVILLDAIRPTTPVRPFLLTKQRWQRFSALFVHPRELHAQNTAPGNAPARHWKTTLTQAKAKLENVVRYEAARTIKSVWVSARQQLLRYLLSRGLAWPHWIPSLSVREIYNFRARSSFDSGAVRARVALVKAEQGTDVDDAGSELVEDPFLGWRANALGPLTVIDAVGGHVGMLQEPAVDLLARDIVRLLASTKQA